ncbi:MAG TPA: rRNA maturation RNase YbeY [Allosphingosinicella sp.]|nr:rRNA maturation RNase YbeY [Allosphingosinicella sp.]
MLLVEADVSPEWDSRTDWPQVASRAARAAVAHSRHAALLEREVEVSVKFTSDAEVRALNAAWRGKDRATNVLSFPMAGEAELEAAILLGDIVLAHGVCVAEAEAMKVPAASHAAHLVAHGMLHLLGYDHERGEAQADDMEETERRALAAIGLPDPYATTEVQP